MIAGAGTKYFAISLFFSTGLPVFLLDLIVVNYRADDAQVAFFIGVERILNYGRRNVSDGSPAFGREATCDRAMPSRVATALAHRHSAGRGRNASTLWKSRGPTSDSSA